jgi:hypothetical protein
MAYYNLSVLPELKQALDSSASASGPAPAPLTHLSVFYSNVNGRKYSVVRYNKSELSLDNIPTYGLCRSLILNSHNKLIGFAPPKSINVDDLTTITTSMTAEEFVEGTMINVFWDDGWEISTRTKVGGETRFFKETQGKTFRALFFETCVECHLDIENLNKELCYSFVMQHPENRIVVPFSRHALYLVAVYKIDADQLHVHSIDYRQCGDGELGLKNSTVKFPSLYENNEDLIKKYASSSTSYDVVGVVLYDKLTGRRMKIRNPVYEQVKQLRGNQPSMQYHYLTLRKEGKVKDFLRYFPEHREQLSLYRTQVHLFTRTLFTNYVSCYIKKEKPLGEFEGQFRTHMFNLHKLYQTNRQLITNLIVVDYVNNLHPSLLMHGLNYHFKT